MGLNDSAFEPEPQLASKLAKAFMWTYDGRLSKRLRSSLVSDRRACLYTNVIDWPIP